MHSYKYNEIDLCVLNELPADIRREILSECHIVNDEKTTTIDKKIGILHNFTFTRLFCLLFIIKDCDIKKNANDIKQKKGFHTLTFEELKVALIKWINFKKGPKDTDIKMLGSYSRQLAIDREIEKLHVMIKFLFR